MEVSFGTSAIPVPPNARHTEITTYMWPGFLGELDHSSDQFTVWEIVGPTRWKPRPDIHAPPYTCLGIERTSIQTWSEGPEQWSLQKPLQKPLQKSLWRHLRSG